MKRDMILEAGELAWALREGLRPRVKAVRDEDGNITFEATDAAAQDSGGAIMDIAEVAALLRKPVSAVRELTKARAQRAPHPIPIIRVGRSVRFKREAILRWLETGPQRPRRKR